MPTRCLPRDPNLEQLRTLAKTLQRLAQSDEAGAVEFVREFHPRFTTVVNGAHELASLSRADMQLALARSYGFASWAKLRDHVQAVNRLTRNPHLQPVGNPIANEAVPVDEFLLLACLTYGADDSSRRERARALLVEHPELATSTIHTMAAVGHVSAARELLAADPSQASREGGPHGWAPLLYVAYSRIDSTAAGHSTLDVARLLLEAGADANAGYLWESEYPFTALTGAFGDGESGQNTPRHQYSAELAQLLLEAGADANDSQALYNRRWRPDDAHLELLFDYGLGRGMATVWCTRIGRDHPTPQELVEEELRWAAARNYVARARLLLTHVDNVDGLGLDHPLLEGHTALRLSMLYGNTEIAHLLTLAHSRPQPLSPLEDLRAACMRGDRPAVDQLLAQDATLGRQIIDTASDLVSKAAELGRVKAVRVLADIGFDLNPTERPTPLHEAAFHGYLDLIRELIDLGANPAARDPFYDSTPLGWAQYNLQHDAARYLARLNGETSK